MSDPVHPAPTSHSTPGHAHGWLKAALIGMLGLGGGAAGTYATALVDKVVKPTRPVANFAASPDGMTLACQNHATGESGWWDFGDGTPLEPYQPDQHVSHTYSKPGGYTVKLTVRNYLGDENERTVPIEVSVAPAQTAAAPAIAGLTVQPVSANVAPATFRLTADVSNADTCVWDLGDGRVEVTAGGKIDRLVTFEKPGTPTISLVAHNGKQGAKQSAAVTVAAARDGTTMAVLRVTDTGSKVDRVTTTESVAVPAPTDKAATGFTKKVHARPGFTITDAAPADAHPAVKDLKVEVAEDRHSVRLTGSWAGDLKETNKAAGGSDPLVRVKLTQERTTAVPASVTTVTGAFANVGGTSRAELALPPAPLGLTGGKREYALEVRSVSGGKSTTAVQTPQPGKPPLTFPWSHTQTGPNWSVTYAAKLEGETVVVTWAQGQ